MKRPKRSKKKVSVCETVRRILRETDMTLPEIVALTMFIGIMQNKV